MPEQVKGVAARKRRSAPVRTVGWRGSLPEHQFHRPLWLSNILRERIVTGVYQPGVRIREAELHAEFGFSNGPIREALQMIVAEGLAERVPWQGVRVVSLNDKQIAELFEVRLALLEFAAELAARQASDEAIKAAPDLKDHIDRGYKELEAGKIHPSFHGELSRWLMNAAGNDKLKKLWNTTMQQTLIYVNAAVTRSAGANICPLLHELIDSVVERDVLAARQAVRKLTIQTLRDLNIDSIIRRP
jgi:DNA-binding GntR family transcriptional regulator